MPRAEPKPAGKDALHVDAMPSELRVPIRPPRRVTGVHRLHFPRAERILKEITGFQARATLTPNEPCRNIDSKTQMRVGNNVPTRAWYVGERFVPRGIRKGFDLADRDAAPPVNVWVRGVR